MIIDEKAVIAVAELKNFNMELFKKYLAYQNENRDNYFGKWSVEEYAAVMFTRDANLDFFTHENLEWFGNWMGFGGEYFIPDCLSFLRYCGARDLYPYNEKRNETFSRALKNKKETSIN